VPIVLARYSPFNGPFPLQGVGFQPCRARPGDVTRTLDSILGRERGTYALRGAGKAWVHAVLGVIRRKTLVILRRPRLSSAASVTE